MVIADYSSWINLWKCVARWSHSGVLFSPSGLVLSQPQKDSSVGLKQENPDPSSDHTGSLSKLEWVHSPCAHPHLFIWLNLRHKIPGITFRSISIVDRMLCVCCAEAPALPKQETSTLDPGSQVWSSCMHTVFAWSWKVCWMRAALLCIPQDAAPAVELNLCRSSVQRIIISIRNEGITIQGISSTVIMHNSALVAQEENWYNTCVSFCEILKSELLVLRGAEIHFASKRLVQC